MDGNDGRRLKARWRQHKDVKGYRRTVSKFLSTYKQSLLTSALLVVVVVLLFGIFSQFQAPPATTPPGGVTVLSYSTFIRQVKASNVLAVAFQGNDINALLASPLSQNHTLTAPPAASANKNTADFAAWSRYVGAGYPSWPSTSSSPPINPSRAVYTHLPGSGDANLMQLLLHYHVMV